MININDSHINPELTFKRLVYLHMQQLTNFPYIEKDFDALTDYELLCLVVKFLNYVIKNSNDQNDSITNLYNAFLALQDYMNNSVQELEDAWNDKTTELETAFNQLHDYVQNYFANLDVQEEINNKLDQMLEDGVLEQIIEQFIQTNAVWCFDNIADMKLATNLINGSITRTLGFNTIGDGGASTYKVRTIEEEEIPDEMFVISLYDETLVAELVLSDTISVKQLGAIENTTDIGSLINTIVNTKDKIAYVPKGSWTVTTTIAPTDYKIINVDGTLNYTGNDSCIKLTGKYNKINITDVVSSGLVLLFENNDSTLKCKNNEVVIDGYASSTTTHAIEFHSIEQGVAYNRLKFKTLAAESTSSCIYIKTEGTGTYSRYVAESTITGGQCIAGTYGIYIDTSTSGALGEVTGMHFETISFEGVTNGIYINNARGNNFTYCRYGELSGHFIKFKGTPNNNRFQILSNVYANKLDLSEINNNSYMFNYFDCSYTTSTGTNQAGRFILNGNKIKLKDLTKGNKYINISTQEATFTFDNDTVATFIFVSTSTQPEINLNQYYGSTGIDYLFIETSRGFTLKDANGTTITSGTNGPTTYRYYCHCYNKNDTDTWYVEKIAVS